MPINHIYQKITLIKIRYSQKLIQEVISLKKTGSLIGLFLCICIFTISIMGCSARNTRYPNQPGTQRAQYQKNLLPRVNTPGGVTPQGMNPQNATTRFIGVTPGTSNPGVQLSQQITNDRQRSEKIRTQLNSMNGVDQSSVIISGNTAIVGILTKAPLKDMKPVTAAVDKKVKQIDRSITKVVVTGAPDIVKQINRLSTDITSNKPANEITNSFNKLIKRINPMS
jgi:YhcN/YlaJ family sporulation lipoprotein